jgi:hypothetical protein
MAAAGKGQTDWVRLGALDDIQAVAHAAQDMETIIPSVEELGAVAPMAGVRRAAQVVIHESRAGEFRWCLRGQDGVLLAVDPAWHATKDAALAALKAVFAALGDIDGLAA